MAGEIERLERTPMTGAAENRTGTPMIGAAENRKELRTAWAAEKTADRAADRTAGSPELICKAPAFSLILPAYNVAQYIGECLNSILDQTLLDFEVICINDGSKDNTLEIIRQFAAMDSRIRVIDWENHGLSAARNAGLDAACGEYICFVDTDDYLEKNALEVLYGEIMDSGPDLIVFGAHVFPERKDIPVWVSWYLDISERRFDRYDPEIILNGRAYPYVWRNCFRRTFLTENALRFDTDIKYAEDMLFQVTALRLVEKSVFITDKLYHYRFGRKNSLLDTFHTDPSVKLNRHVQVCEAVGKEWNRRGFTGNSGTEFMSIVMDFAGCDLCRTDIPESRNSP